MGKGQMDLNQEVGSAEGAQGGEADRRENPSGGTKTQTETQNIRDKADPKPQEQK